MRAIAAFLVLVLVAPQAAGAQTPHHSVVSQARLDAALRSSSDQRAANLQKIRGVLDDPDVVRAARPLTDTRQLATRLGALDDRTLERLAAEAEAIRQPQGGGKAVRVVVIVMLALVILAVVASALAPESS